MDWDLVNMMIRLLQPALLVLPRVLSALIVLPLFPSEIFPPMIRTGLALSLSLVLYPMAAPYVSLAPHPTWVWAALMAKEILLGALIGYALGSIVWAFQGVGALIDNQTGMSNAETYDPFGGHQGGPASPFMTQLVICLLLAGGSFNVLVTLLCESYLIWPLDALYPAPSRMLVDFGASQVSSVTELTVKLSAPLILLLVLAELSLGLINRIAPQFNVFHFAMPIKGALALLVLALGVATMVDIVRSDTSVWPARLEGLNQAIGRR